jgi:hypothetical protein
MVVQAVPPSRSGGTTTAAARPGSKVRELGLAAVEGGIGQLSHLVHRLLPLDLRSCADAEKYEDNSRPRQACRARRRRGRSRGPPPRREAPFVSKFEVGQSSSTISASPIWVISLASWAARIPCPIRSGRRSRRPRGSLGDPVGAALLADVDRDPEPGRARLLDERHEVAVGGLAQSGRGPGDSESLRARGFVRSIRKEFSPLLPHETSAGDRACPCLPSFRIDVPDVRPS